MSTASDPARVHVMAYWMLGTAVSLLIIVHESVRPQVSMLWRLPGTQIYRNVKQESDGLFVPEVMIVRIGASNAISASDDADAHGASSSRQH